MKLRHLGMLIMALILTVPVIHYGPGGCAALDTLFPTEAGHPAAQAGAAATQAANDPLIRAAASTTPWGQTLLLWLGLAGSALMHIDHAMRLRKQDAASAAINQP